MTRASSPGAHIGRYLSVGGLCATAHNVIMIAGGLFHWFYTLSFALSYVVVTLLGYVLHVHYTFGLAPTRRGLGRFAGANALGAQMSFGLTALLISGLGFSVVVAAPVVTLILFFWNFAATHWALRVPRPTRF